MALLLGARLSLPFRPSHLVSAVLALHEPGAHGSGPFWPLVIFALVGGVLLVVPDHPLSTRGASLRKISTSITHFTKLDTRRDQQCVQEAPCGTKGLASGVFT